LGFLNPLFLLAAIASPSPSPAATLPAGLGPEWSAVATIKGEVAHYERPYARGPADQLFVTKELCQCQSGELFDTLSSEVLEDQPAAVVERSADSACGHSVDHLVMTGVADGLKKRNVDAFAYRTTDSLVVITYSFSKPSPSKQDEASMRVVCPPEVPSS
jgi:hypothetical protein